MYQILRCLCPKKTNIFQNLQGLGKGDFILSNLLQNKNKKSIKI